MKPKLNQPSVNLDHANPRPVILQPARYEHRGPRGKCDTCGRVFALRTDGRVRVHAGHWDAPPCAGSGMPPIAKETGR